jgi:uncharacterized repeat protein (TIGR01451 family)
MIKAKNKFAFVMILAFALIFMTGFTRAWVCGDGIIQSPDSSGIYEQCDDGNTINYDGCSSNCTIEIPCNLQLTKSINKQTAKPNDTITYTLKYKNIGGTTCTGGGVEIQDTLDGGLSYTGSFTKNIINDLDNDGLDASWYAAPGYDALTNTLTWNAHRVSPGEEGTITFNVKVLTPTKCGDFVIPNFFKAWSNQENWKSSNTVNLNVDYNCPVCGDGIVNQANETCDDGNLNNNDGCSSTCKIERCGDNICNNGETCSTCSCDCGVCAPACGNGIKEAGEQCDDHNLNNNDGCSSTCKTESCGDGIKQTCEQCDKGTVLNGQVCNPLYGSSCTYCSTQCTNVTLNGPYCGDNTCNGAETCSTCASDCGVCAPVCGNGQKETGEQCDDNNLNNNDGCSSTCKIEICGDNIKQTSEQCDKGTLNGNVCSPLYGSSCTYCSTQCTNVTLNGPYCGDNTCNGAETCSTCASDCGTCAPVCGNGVKEIGEQCDDHNTVSGDGCSSTCKTEYCGDGIKQTNEQCDDHNTVNGDGCSSTCKIEICGDNICNNGETCSTCSCDCGYCAPTNPANKTKLSSSNSFVQFCDVAWVCSSWSECSDGVMTRNCVDKNNCDTDYNKPNEQSGCSGKVLSNAYVEKENVNPLWIILGVVLFVLLLLLIIYLLK